METDTIYKKQPDVDYIYSLTDPNNCDVLYFKCIKERHNHSRTLIREHLDADGWNEEVCNITMSTVTHVITEYNKTERPDDEEIDEEGCDAAGTYWGEWLYRCDYKLTPVELTDDDEEHF